MSVMLSKKKYSTISLYKVKFKFSLMQKNIFPDEIVLGLTTPHLPINTHSSMYVYVKDRKDLFENVCIGTKHYKTKDAGALFIRCNDVDRLMTKMDIDQLTFDKLSLLGINLTNHDLLKRMTY